MFRAFNTDTNKWEYGIVLAPNSSVFKDKKLPFGLSKLDMIVNDDEHIVISQSIAINDKSGNLIFEGDILRQESTGIFGIVAYHPDTASYYLLDYENERYYPIGSEICESELEIVGNIFDNSNFIKEKTTENTAEHTEETNDEDESDK